MMNSIPVLAKSGLSRLDTLYADKLHAWHRERLAVVYVRQSTAQQVLDHQESTRLQYGLVNRAQALGWAADRVLVIDDDLGKSAASTQGRAGFQRLVSEVSLDHVGIDRKSTRLNSSHSQISYAVFCLKKKNVI